MNTTSGARDFSWMLNNFVEQSAGVTDAIAVSSDGLLMAMSDSLDRDGAEQLAAIVSGLVSLGQGAATCFGFGGLQQVIVAMDGGYAFLSSISDGSCLGVVATSGCDIGQIGYQSGLLVERAGAVLTPELVEELQQELLATS